MSTQVEGQQIALRLTTDREVLDQLRRNKILVEDDEGEVLTLQFDSQTFRFRAGNTIALGKSMANALIRESAVIVGDPNDPDYQITGDFRAGLDKVRSFDIGKGQAENVCTFCSETTDANGNLFTPSTLGYHMMRMCPQAAKATAEMEANEKAVAKESERAEPRKWTPPPKTLAKGGPKSLKSSVVASAASPVTTVAPSPVDSENPA